MFRRILLVILALVVLLIVGLMSVQIVLWTDVPRRIVVDTLSRETGLVFQADGLATGWFGRTTVTDVRVFLPLEDRPFAVVPEMRVEHNALLSLLVLRAVDIRAIEIDRPHVIAEEEEGIGWNVGRAVELITTVQAAKEGGEGGFDLPRLVIAEGTLEIIRPHVDPLTLALDLRGAPVAVAAWHGRAELGDLARAEIRLGPAPSWPHEIDFMLRDVDRLAALWDADVPAPIGGQGRWRGSVADGVMTGRLRLDRTQVGDAEARGSVDVRLAAVGGPVGGADPSPASPQPAITLRPRDVVLSAPWLPEGPIHISRGTITSDLEDFRITHLIADWAGMSAELSGRWFAGRREGELTANWTGAPAGMPFEQTGTIRASLALPLVGQQRIEAAILASTTLQMGELETDLRLHSTGSAWAHMQTRLEAPTLTWTDEEGVIDLGGLAARFALDWPTISLTRLTIPDARIAQAQAQFNQETNEWSAQLEVSDWRIPRIEHDPLSLTLRASGDFAQAEVSELHLTGGGIAFDGRGTWFAQRDVPLEANAVMSVAARPEEIRLQRRGLLAGTNRGDWRLEAQLQGDVHPLNLVAQGEVVGENFTLPAGPLPPITVRWTGQVDQRGAMLDSEPFDLLGGLWEFRARFDRRRITPALRLTVDGLPLNELVTAFAIPVEVEGAVTANLDVVVPDLDPQRLEFAGRWAIADLATLGWTIERGEGRVVTRHGRVEFEEIEFLYGGGRAHGRLGFALEQQHLLRVEAGTIDWPIALTDADIEVRIDSDVRLVVDLAQQGAYGVVTLRGPVFAEGDDFGRFDIATRLNGRTLHLTDVRAEVGDGELSGWAVIPIDEHLQSRASFQWHNLELFRLVLPWTQQPDLTGRLSGRLEAAPSDDPRAIEPLRIHTEFSTIDAGFGPVEIGGGELTFFVGPRRTVLDGSRLEVAGGVVNVWSRLTRHGPELFTHFDIAIPADSAVDLQQFARLLDPDIDLVPGELSGEVSFGGYLDWDNPRTFGSARLDLARSDLGNVPALSFLYGAMSLRPMREPDGRGEAVLRLEGDTLEVWRLNYFNRGADIVGNVRLHDIRQGPQTPISGIVAGTIRPLRDVRLPLIPQVDELIHAFQTEAISVRLEGTLAEPDHSTVPFAEVGRTVRRLLGDGPPRN